MSKASHPPQRVLPRRGDIRQSGKQREVTTKNPRASSSTPSTNPISGRASSAPATSNNAFSSSSIPPDVFYSHSHLTQSASAGPSSHQSTSRPLRGENTMVADKLDSNGPFTSTYRVINKIERNMLTESRGKYVGPIPPRIWLDEFMPAPKDQKRPKVSFKKVIAAIASGKGEVAMYEPFLDVCCTLNQSRRNMKFEDTSAKPDPRTVPAFDTVRQGSKPDCMFYCEDSLPHVNRPTDFSRGDVPGEFKLLQAADPFCDKLDGDRIYPFENVFEQGMDTRGQITRYASAILQMQYRRFCFSFVIFGRLARLIRWDRSGAVVTKAFDYGDDPEPLAQFVWRYGFLTRAQRGLDESVMAITPAVAVSIDDLYNARRALERDVHDISSRDLFLLRMTPLSEYSHPSASTNSQSSSIHCGHNDQLDGWDYIVSSPEYRDRGPFGKATRSLYVYDRFCGHIRHLKDSWRVDDDEYEVEHQIIQALHQAKVLHIGSVHDARDVAPQGYFYNTITPAYATRDGVGFNIAFVRHRLYRLISEEIGRALWEFRSSKELVQVIADALQAHQMAEKAGYRHRDISVGNILITHDGHALLIDWDASKKIALMNRGKGRLPDQTGTWQFISAARLRNSAGPHLILDELESFFWVLLWIALKYCRHALTEEELADELQEIFDHGTSNAEGSEQKGGVAKFALLRDPSLTSWLKTKIQPPRLEAVLDAMHRTLAPRYMPPVAPAAEDKERAEARGADRWEIELKMYDLAVEQHKNAMDDLKDATWMRKILQMNLTKDDWPEHDRAQLNRLPILDMRPKKRSDDCESALAYLQAPAIAASRPSKRARTEAEESRREAIEEDREDETDALEVIDMDVATEKADSEDDLYAPS